MIRACPECESKKISYRTDSSVICLDCKAEFDVDEALVVCDSCGVVGCDGLTLCLGCGGDVLCGTQLCENCNYEVR